MGFPTKKLLNVDSYFQNESCFNNSGEDCLSCGPLNLEYFNVFYIPIIISVGLLGNSLSCLVFLATFLKMRSSSYYLSALAIADTIYLSSLLVVHCSSNEVWEIYHRDGWCQLFVYLSSVSSTLSVWFIVAFTVERFIAIKYPLKRPHMCTVSRAKLIVLVLTITAMLSHCFIFWTAGIVTPQGLDECEMKPEYFNFMKIINFIDSILTFILPFVLIVIMNAMIGRNIFMFRKRIQHGTLEELKNVKQFPEQKDISQSSIKQQGASSNNQRTQLTKKDNKGHLSSIHIKPSSTLISSKTQHNISKMLLLVSSVFIVLNLPSYGIRLYVYFAYESWELPSPEILCMQQFAMMLFYTNYSINFLLYAMYGITFRKCLIQLVRNNFNRLKSMIDLRTRRWE